MEEKLPISVAIIARDEEATIGRCLASIRDWVAEMVVVVNDCTDGTEEIARSQGATVIEQRWLGYREQKNCAISHTSQPWILSLDGDEVVSPKLRKFIAAFLGNPGRHVAARLCRRMWIMGRWIRFGDCNPRRSYRLFLKDHGRWVGNSVHEGTKIDGTIKKLSGPLDHFSYQSLGDKLERVHRYANLHVGDRKNGHYSTVSIALRALWRFLRGYVFRLGFLDGFPGFYIALSRAFWKCYSYFRVLEEQRKNKWKIPPVDDVEIFSKK